ncbi:MAG: DNA replication and repair protein RecF [Alistipes sp.]|nr:DNA replication and repair protein RecF [Candidatus Alistipes equi]
MQLRKLHIRNFKNLEDEVLEIDSGITCFVGENGTCKTNLLDAIYYLSMCRSAVGQTESQCVKTGEDFFGLQAEYLDRNLRMQYLSATYTRQGKKCFKFNDTSYTRLSDHIGVIPVVIISPMDNDLINDAAEQRRHFFDQFISQIDRNYLRALIRYSTALSQRNSLLKGNFTEEILSIYDVQLSHEADTIFRVRKDVIERVFPMLAQFYGVISGHKERVSLAYRSALTKAPLTELLLECRERDRVMQYTTQGVHRDDFLFSINDVQLRKFGSQGQQKSFIIALKLAQSLILSELSGEKPILLLDDIFDKLDETRVRNMMQILSSGDFGQIFITDCNHNRIKRVMDDINADYKIVDVEFGKIVREINAI